MAWLGRELGDRRQHAEGVGRQHDDVLGMAGGAGLAGIGDEVERIGGAGVLGEPAIVEVGHARDRIHDDVLQNVPKRLVAAQIWGSASGDRRMVLA